MSTLATAEESRTKLVSDAEDPQENAKKLRGQADELREEARELRQEARQMQKNGKEELADKRIAEADKRIAEADKRIAEAEKLISTQAWRGNREAIDELAEVVTREVGKLNEGLQPLRNAVFGIPARTCHSATTAARGQAKLGSAPSMFRTVLDSAQSVSRVSRVGPLQLELLCSPFV